MHSVTFKDSDDLQSVIKRENSSKTTLTEYFRMNLIAVEARNYLYREFPEHYVWHNSGKYWSRRQKKYEIGRIIAANPTEGEKYYLRILLNHVKGATSFVDLLTINGVQYNTFRESAEHRGLIDTDNSISECLSEAATFQFPCGLRCLFATILVYCEPSNIRTLWDAHFESMSEDYCHDILDHARVEQLVLREISSFLESIGKIIDKYNLPSISNNVDNYMDGGREVYEEMSIIVEDKHLNAHNSLNSEQMLAFEEIMSHVYSSKSGLFFIDGPGGTGKSFLYRALLAKVRSLGLIAIATATSGVAAAILPSGRTAHSRFKIPIIVNDDSMCNITKQSGTAELLRRVSMIVWDEASMTKKQAFEALDQTMQDIIGSTLPFGGKIMVFGGDFRQVLPLIRRGTKGQIIESTLRASYIWPLLKKFRLTQNMRARSDPWFSQYLLRIRNGEENTMNADYIRLPNEIVIKYTHDKCSKKELIDAVFPSLSHNANSCLYIISRAILSTKNEYVDDLNKELVMQFPGSEFVYHSFDVADDDTNIHYPSEFLNSLTPSGLPPHKLTLKINCPIILLRNIDQVNGLCNGTRLICKGFQSNANRLWRTCW